MHGERKGNKSPCEAGRGARQRGFVSARMKKAEKRAVLAQRLEENYDRNLLREVI